MAWLRIDDGFASHPKIAALTDRELRVWLRVLCYCARHGDPSVDSIALSEIKGLSRKVVDRYADLGLVDVAGGSYEVHDWAEYAPKDATNADRQARWRARNTVTPPVTNTVTSSVTNPLPHARAGAVVPSRPVPGKPSAKASGLRPPDELWDVFTEELGDAQTESERGRRNKALKELRAIGATPQQLRKRIAGYRRNWPDVALTATAVAANWTTLGDQEVDTRDASVRLMEAAARRGH